MTLTEFFDDRDAARAIFDAVEAEIEKLGPYQVRVSKSQVAFRNRRDFAWAWTPDRYLRGQALAPFVLSLSFHEPDPSKRWKEIVEPAPGRFMHHLELRTPEEVNDQVREWLIRAWNEAA